jgi:DNA-directed RNA polymerase
MKTNEQLQVEREIKMVSTGVLRFNKKSEKAQTAQTNNQAHSMIEDAVPLLEDKIKKIVEATKRGQPTIGLSDIKKVDVAKLAYIGLNTCWDASIQSKALTGTLIFIGRKVELEIWANEFQSLDKKAFKRITSTVNKEHSIYYKRVHASLKAATKEGFDFESWDDRRRVQVGNLIFSAVLAATDLFEVFNIGTALKTKRVLGLTSEATQTFKDKANDASWAEPAYGPMIVPPRPWVSPTTGAYLDLALSMSVPIVRKSSAKQRKMLKSDFDACEGSKVPPYVEALNALQATPLQINKYVLEAVEHLWEKEIMLSGFPSKKETEMPEILAKDEWLKLTPQVQFDRRAERQILSLSNRAIRAGQIQLDQDISTAHEMAQYDYFYTPFSFDFRGRMYPVSHFNYHREDHIRSMIQLGNGKPLGETGAGWLAVYLANCGDFNKISKESLEDRATWTQDNEDLITKVGTDFKGSFDIWSQADKPFAFLAACNAYVGYLNEGDAYVCHLAPSLDGSNSGIQHFAAMLLNESDGELSNLVPTTEMADLYQIVADRVGDRLKKEDGTIASKWKEFGVTRKTVKRNCLSYGYSSGRFGMADQLYDDLMAPLDTERRKGLRDSHPFGTQSDQHRHCQFLAKLSFEEIEEVVTSVNQAMKFLQSAASSLAHEGANLTWRTPVGFPVVQNYTEWCSQIIQIHLHDRVAKISKTSQISIRRKDETDIRIDKRKAKSSAAANFVHSADASHMASTILQCLDHGITDFMMIHDSFATSCDQTWELFHHVRDAFVDQYKDQCLLTELRDSVKSQLNDPDTTKLLPVPKRGNLNLDLVKESDFCFS